jgi:PKHD-type hydroxylase
MLLTFPLLDAAELRQAERLLAQADWTDGRSTAGAQAVQVKNNQQLDSQSEPARALQSLVMRALDRSPRFLAAALPGKLFPPHFNRYTGETNHYGPHVDGAVRFLENGSRIRTDLSCTVFLSEPDSYEGGELVIHEAQGERNIKLRAGHAVLYPGTSVHEVRAVRRGVRLAAFFWVESMVRSAEQRQLLLELDDALTQLRAEGETPATVALTGTYHNLLRMWAQT